MIEVMTFAVASHDVGEFWIRDVASLKEQTQAFNKMDIRERVTIRTGSRVSGVSPHLPSQFIDILPSKLSGSALGLSISTTFVLTRGLSLRVLRPSADSSVMSRNLGSTGYSLYKGSNEICKGC